MTKLQAFFAVSLMSLMGSAHAALPAGATTAFNDLTTTVSDLADAAWPVVAAVVGALAAIGLFKRFVSKIA